MIQHNTNDAHIYFLPCKKLLGSTQFIYAVSKQIKLTYFLLTSYIYTFYIHSSYIHVVKQVISASCTDRGCRFSPDSQVCTHTFHDADGTQACFVAHTDTRMSSQIHTTTWGKLEKTLCWTLLQSGETSDVKKIILLTQIGNVPGSTTLLVLGQQSTQPMYQ